MPKAVRAYVRYVDAVNRVVGRIAMYMIFAMMGLLLYSSITKTFFIPPIWSLEMAQFRPRLNSTGTKVARVTELRSFAIGVPE